MPRAETKNFCDASLKMRRSGGKPGQSFFALKKHITFRMSFLLCYRVLFYFILRVFRIKIFRNFKRETVKREGNVNVLPARRMPIRAAARDFDVPKPTLLRQQNNRISTEMVEEGLYLSVADQSALEFLFGG